MTSYKGHSDFGGNNEDDQVYPCEIFRIKLICWKNVRKVIEPLGEEIIPSHSNFKKTILDYCRNICRSYNQERNFTIDQEFPSP